MTRPNNNNILKNKTSNGKCNSTNTTTANNSDSPKCLSTDSRCNSTEMKLINAVTTSGTTSLMCNSNSLSLSSASNKCNSTSNKCMGPSTVKKYYSEMDAKWTGQDNTNTNKCSEYWLDFKRDYEVHYVENWHDFMCTIHRKKVSSLSRPGIVVKSGWD